MGMIFGNRKKKKQPDTEHEFECPKCHAYGEYETTEYRGLTFSCAQCLGWGWVTIVDTLCVHRFDFVKQIANSLKEYQCIKCDRIKKVDSSG